MKVEAKMKVWHSVENHLCFSQIKAYKKVTNIDIFFTLLENIYINNFLNDQQTFLKIRKQINCQREHLSENATFLQRTRNSHVTTIFAVRKAKDRFSLQPYQKAKSNLRKILNNCLLSYQYSKRGFKSLKLLSRGPLLINY